MEGEIAKVLDRGCRVVVDARKSKASKNLASLNRGSRTGIPQLSALNAPSVKLGKRKKPDDCSVKCSRFVSGKSLYRAYSNFMKSRKPTRLMCHEDEEWVDLPFEILGLVKKDIELKKGVTEVNISGRHLLLDFLHMIHLDVKTGLKKPLAWMDEAGRCFFPEVLAFDNQYDGSCELHDGNGDSNLLSRAQGQHGIKVQIDIELNGLKDTPTIEYCGESNPIVKRVKIGQNRSSRDLEAEDSCDRVSVRQTNENAEHLEKILDNQVQVIDETLEPEVVTEMFLKGMDSKSGVDIINVSPCSGSMLQARMELFQKQVEITDKYRGNANVQYAWLASSKEALSSIMAYGLGSLGLPSFEPSYGTGVHLAGANYSRTSAKYCDIDENGVRYVILCRVIMGNMELIDPGSKQFSPSSEKFDNGVDNLDHPQRYVVWSVNLNTHIYPEFVVSFKISPGQEGCMAGGDKLEFSGVSIDQQSPELRSSNDACASAVDKRNGYQINLANEGHMERAINLNPHPMRIPKSPWMPFPMLFAAIESKISADHMKLIFAHYDLYRTTKIPRVEFVRTLRLIVGDPLLRSTISSLQSKGPAENKSTLEVAKQEHKE